MLTFEQLQPGSFYMPVFERIEPQGTDLHERFRIDAPYYKYLGGREFETEDGESVHGFYDPELGLEVAVDAPDGFIQ